MNFRVGDKVRAVAKLHNGFQDVISVGEIGIIKEVVVHSKAFWVTFSSGPPWFVDVEHIIPATNGLDVILDLLP